MKSILQSTLFITALMFASCQDAPVADDAKISAAKEVKADTNKGKDYKVDLTQSSLKWIGTKLTGRQHGTVLISEGMLSAMDSNIIAGNFSINMNSITAYDDDNSVNPKLENHLKSADFFDVNNYNTATFEITAVKAATPTNEKNLVMKEATHTVTGNLRIKNITKSITFPAEISFIGNAIVADAEFNINRTLWGITYHSDKSLGNKFINDDINFNVHLVAER